MQEKNEDMVENIPEYMCGTHCTWLVIAANGNQECATKFHSCF